MTNNQSKIEKLIAELCPKGVGFKELADLDCFRIVMGQSPDGMSVSTNDSGIEFHQGKTNFTNFVIAKSGQHTSKPAKIAEANSVLMSVRAPVGSINYTDRKICIGRGLCAIHTTKKVLNMYLFYVMQIVGQKLAETSTGSTFASTNLSNVKAIKIPLPPLAVQEEIVKILDSFTELEAELEARKKQYEHYRDSLLKSSDMQSTTYRLGDIAKNLDSKRKPVTRSARKSGSIPYYGASGIVDSVSEYIFEGDYLLVSEDGANLLARNTPIAFSITGKTWVNNHAHVLQFESATTQRFVEIYLNSIDLISYISGAAQPKLNQENLNRIEIPLPSLAEQDRIVKILDKFDALVNDISIGLPAELSARRQQYEYYRGKLLTFNEYAK